MKKIIYISVIFIVVLLMRFNTFVSLPDRDASIFAYTGSLILDGGLPYLNSWDHKPPLIYLLNAGIFKMFGKGFSQIAIFEFIWIIISVICFYKLALNFFKKSVSLFITLFFAVIFGNDMFVQSYGMTETYMILPAMLSVYYIFRFYKTGLLRYVLLSGIMCCLSFMFRQTGILIILPVLISFMYQLKKSQIRLKTVFVYFIGIIIPIIPIINWFWFKGAFFDYIDQVFIFNSIYIKEAGFSYFENLKTSYLIKYPALLISFIAGYFCVIIFEKKVLNRIVLLSWFLADLFSVVISRRFFDHYFIQMLPVMVLISGYFFSFIFNKFNKIVTLALIILTLCFSGVIQKMNFFFAKTFSGKSICILNDRKFLCREDQKEILYWTLENTSVKDKLFIWGAEDWIFFLTDRKCSSRYSYVYPLLTERYFSSKMTDELLIDFKHKTPKYIYVSKENLQTFLNPPEYLKRLIAYINKEYVIFYENKNWKIYKNI